MPQSYVPRHRRPAQHHWAPWTAGAGAVLSMVAVAVALAVMAIQGLQEVATGGAQPAQRAVAIDTVEPEDACSTVSGGNDVAQGWEAAFNQMPSWRAADQGSSVPLGDGRVLWLFNDTIAETAVGQDMVRNSVVVTSNGCPEFDSTTQGTEFFPGEDDQWWWPTHGIPDQEGAWVLAGEFYGGTEAWDFTHIRAALFLVTVEGGTPRVVQEIPVPPQPEVNWSAGLAQAGSYMVLYGVDSDQRLRVARTPRASVGSIWEYGLGSGRWGSNFPKAMQGPQVATTSLSVSVEEGQWTLLAKPGGLLGDKVVEFEGPSAQGPFTAETLLPLPAESHERWTYNPVRHPWAAVPDGHSLISISQNVPDIREVYRDYSLYRPRFILVPDAVLGVG